MARSLNNIIFDIFATTYYRNRYRGYMVPCFGVPNSLYMEIPIDKEEIEIPIFAFPKFRDVISESSDVNSIIVQLETRGGKSCYSSLNKILEDTLTECYDGSRLLIIKDKNTENTYYGTYGAIFNSEFEPVLMCSWVIRKYLDEDGHIKFECVHPIIRISPTCFVNQGDSVERLISKKFPIEALSHDRYYFYNRTGQMFIEHHDAGYVPKIIIEETPFSFKKADVPSISTTNESLLKAALDNIDDFRLWQ